MDQTGGVSFEEAASQNTNASVGARASGLERFAMKYSFGLLKTPRDAQYALVILIIFLFAFSLFMWLTAPKTNEEPPPRDPQDYLRTP